ncbi:eEF1A lysine and N-terminal methyltransferase isoform X2 [Leucoraja erinacea]|uniref:eEF1A lysine and N-terminal methyltransferase isoform X2 n=1 Tax=Leucoraja erinaceus TaxID=7782 RepID=UPI002455D747|nr:eEF1A lysine and N-terminal methyltransferase isoform X2 [Leucoraja erinacea]
MNLLPKCSKEFSSAEYWETFFKKRGGSAFEWYGTYVDHCAVLHKYIKRNDKVLVVGCGNSELSEQMYDVGYQSITNIDISPAVISHMKERNGARRPAMAFAKMDVGQMEFADSQFQVVLDKGTLDAIMTDESEGTLRKVEEMFGEIGRVLRLGGRFLCISLAQEHIARKAVRYFSQQGWLVRVHVAGERAEAGGGQFVMFTFVFTKFKKLPGGGQGILEMCGEGGDQEKPLRLESVEQLLEAVKERQRYALLRNHLTKGSSSGESLSLTLCDRQSGKPRYSIYVVDQPSIKPARANNFAIFIVPQGREAEWIFGTDEGRKQLGRSADFKRLLVVSLHRDQHYQSMEAIQSELSGKVMELAPSGLPPGQQVPFLSVGGDIGVRKVQHRGVSDASGEYVIEDVKGEDGNYYRHLVFLSNVNVVQSESKLLYPASKSDSTQKKKKKDKRKGRLCSEVEKTPSSMPGQVIDKSYLCCDHHRVMIAGLVFLRRKGGFHADAGVSLLVVGLGGGSLPLFIHDYFSQSTVDTVEIDPEVVEVATKWFEFTQDDRMRVILADGLHYIRTLADSGSGSYDVVMFDVDSKDTTLGMSCPPPAFLEQAFLQKVRSLLAPQGLFVLNLVCRDRALREKAVEVIKLVFPLVCLQKIEGEVNEILYCQLSTELKAVSKDLLEAGQILEDDLKKTGKHWDQTYRLAEMLEKVTIV